MYFYIINKKYLIIMMDKDNWSIKKKKGFAIRKTKSQKVEDPRDHMKSRKLFRQGFNKTFYQMNILTKTQQIIPQTNPNLFGSKRKALSKRLKQLYAPNRKLNFNISKSYQKQNHSDKSRTIQKNKQQIQLQSVNSGIIFKSELVNIDPRAQLKSNKKDTLLTEMSSDEEQRLIKRQLEHLGDLRINGKQRFKVLYPHENKILISKIFETGQYQDKYEQINKYLLKQETLYKEKKLNLSVKRQWRF